MRQLGFLLLLNNLPSSSAAGWNAEPRVIATKSIHIDRQDFNVTKTVTTSTSLIDCGAHFAVARETQNQTLVANGFHFNGQNMECQLGQVSFPVQEVEHGGIRVHGISKLLHYFTLLLDALL